MASTCDEIELAISTIGLSLPVIEFDPVRCNVTKPVSGVYILLLAEDVQYVGQTADIAQRFISHRNSKRKDWDCACKPTSTARDWDTMWFIPVDESRRNDVERVLHDALHPPHNGRVWVRNWRVR